MRSILIALFVVALVAAPMALWAQEKTPTVAEAQEMIKAYNQRLADCNSKVAGLQNDISALQAEIQGLDAKISALESEIAGLRGTSTSTYTVKKGDWLAKLAEYPDVYGRGKYAMWPKIYKANKEKIKDPNLIYPGQVLVIPRSGE
jgi:nucleoid-associated protein YgaU